jgi:hypothetical protein
MRGVVVKRFLSLVGAAGAVAVVLVFSLVPGAGAAAKSASALPTLTLTMNGHSIVVGGSAVSGAVNVQSTVTGQRGASAGLVRLNPGVPYSALAAAEAAVNAHHGDLNYLDPYGSLLFDVPAPIGTSSAQTILTPGNYFALDIPNNGNPVVAPFTVIASAAPAALPTPGATVASIEFGFTGPRVLHDGELVRFVNNGFLVHMDVIGRVKNRAIARRVVALLLAGKDNKAGRLFLPTPNAFVGPLSSGGLAQLVVTEKPGIYVQACFMDTQDGREHTQLGMERIIRIVK